MECPSFEPCLKISDAFEERRQLEEWSADPDHDLYVVDPEDRIHISTSSSQMDEIAYLWYSCDNQVIVYF